MDRFCKTDGSRLQERMSEICSKIRDFWICETDPQIMKSTASSGLHPKLDPGCVFLVFQLPCDLIPGFADRILETRKTLDSLLDLPWCSCLG
jgi:hypothetical protein